MHLCGTLAKEISDSIGLLVFFQGLYRAIAEVSANGKKCICRLHGCFLRVRSAVTECCTDLFEPGNISFV